MQTSDDMSTQDSSGDDPIRVLATHAGGKILAVSLHLPERAWMGGAVIGMAPAEGVEHLRQHASHSPQAHAHALALACALAAGEPPPEKAERLRTERRLAKTILAKGMGSLVSKSMIFPWIFCCACIATGQNSRKIPARNSRNPEVGRFRYMKREFITKKTATH